MMGLRISTSQQGSILSSRILGIGTPAVTKEIEYKGGSYRNVPYDGDPRDIRIGSVYLVEAYYVRS